MKKIIIGIDPGVTGALAIIDSAGSCATEDMPTMAMGKKNKINAAELTKIVERAILGREDKIVCVIEQVSAMPGQGVSGMFNFGMSYGIIQGVCMALKIETHFVTPQKWKKHFSLIGKDKDNARTLAQQFYPEASLARKKDIGRADALLIARYHQENAKI